MSENQEKFQAWMNRCEDCLTFMSIHSFVTDAEKNKIRKRMGKERDRRIKP
jgi:hypothetical protein